MFEAAPSDRKAINSRLLVEPHTDTVKIRICCNRNTEQYEGVFSLSVFVHFHLLQMCSHSFLQIKRAKQLPAKVDIRSWLCRRSEYHCWWDPLSEMVGHKATWSHVYPCWRSQLLSESQRGRVPIPGVVLYHWSWTWKTKLRGSLLFAFKGNRLLIGQW